MHACMPLAPFDVLFLLSKPLQTAWETAWRCAEGVRRTLPLKRRDIEAEDSGKAEWKR